MRGFQMHKHIAFSVKKLKNKQFIIGAYLGEGGIKGGDKLLLF